MINPDQLASTEKMPTAESVERVKALLRYVDWRSLIDGVQKDPESNEVEDIYPIENPVGTSDETAVVIYKGIEEPHKHVGNETEAHIAAEGKATYFVNGQRLPMEPGWAYIIPPDAAHFAEPRSRDFVAVVISSPNFNPDNQVKLSPDNPVERTVLDQYQERVAT